MQANADLTPETQSDLDSIVGQKDRGLGALPARSVTSPVHLPRHLRKDTRQALRLENWIGTDEGTNRPWQKASTFHPVVRRIRHLHPEP